MPQCYALLRIRTFALFALTLALLAPVAAHAVPGDLYVTSDASNQVRHYQPNGTFVNVFTTTFAASGEMAIHFGATNNRVLVGHSFNGVEEFNATTGAYIKTYNPGGGWQWAGVYAPNGSVCLEPSLASRRFGPGSYADQFLGVDDHTSTA